MKKYFCILTAAAIALATSTGLAEQKIATIDLAKVFDGYYKTKQADAALKEEASDLEKERQDMISNFKKGETEYLKLKDKVNDQALAADEREKSKQAADKKYLELKDTQQAIDEFERSARAKLNEKQLRKRNVILDELRDVINVKAKAGGYNFVIDTAAKSSVDTPIVLFNTGESDLTQSVLDQLNAGAPPSVTKSDSKSDKKEQPKTDEKKK